MNKKTKEAIRKLEENIKEAQAQIEELKKEDGIPKFRYPNMCDVFWYVTADGRVKDDNWIGTDIDKRKFHQGSAFLTREETEFEAERERVIKELELFKEPEDRKWNNRNRHYCIGYDFIANNITICCPKFIKYNDIYFETEEDCQKAIDYVGEDRVKKFYLRIKE